MALQDSSYKAYENMFIAGYNQLAKLREGGIVRSRPYKDIAINSDFSTVQFIGKASLKKKTTLFEEQNLNVVQHSVRFMSHDTYGEELGLESDNAIRMVGDPKGAYLQLLFDASSLKKDQIFLKAIFADARSGKQGATIVPFDSNNIIAVNATDKFTGGTPTQLTPSKIMLMLEKAATNNVDNAASGRMHGVITRKHLNDLKTFVASNNFVMTNVDFNPSISMSAGGEETFVWEGITFHIVSPELLELDGSGNYKLPFWYETGMQFGVTTSPSVKIEYLTQRYQSHAINFLERFGATRLEESKCFQILAS